MKHKNDMFYLLFLFKKSCFALRGAGRHLMGAVMLISQVQQCHLIDSVTKY